MRLSSIRDKDIEDPLDHFNDTHPNTCRHCDSHPPLVAPYLFCPSCGTIEMPRKQSKPRMDGDVRMRMRRLQITKIFRHLHGRYLREGDMASIDALAHTIAMLPNAKAGTIVAAVTYWAPWLSEPEAYADRVMRAPIPLSDIAVGRMVKLTWGKRCEIGGINTIAAYDVTDPAELKALRKARKAETDRAKAASKRTGRAPGRPKLTPAQRAERKARRAKAERERRARAKAEASVAENSSPVKESKKTHGGAINGHAAYAATIRGARLVVSFTAAPGAQPTASRTINMEVDVGEALLALHRQAAAA